MSAIAFVGAEKATIIQMPTTKRKKTISHLSSRENLPQSARAVNNGRESCQPAAKIYTHKRLSPATRYEHDDDDVAFNSTFA